MARSSSIKSQVATAPAPQNGSAGATAAGSKRKYISWVALAMMTTGSVASLRSAPAMAVFGLASVFLYIVPAIVFFVPTSLVSAELASGWKGGVFNWVSQGLSARVSLRVPPGMDARRAQDALVAHLDAVAPWHAQVQIERETPGEPFAARSDGPAYTAMTHALEQAYGQLATTEGQGGSIPLCNVLHETFPDAEIILTGVEEPRCLIHAPNESVDPAEIEHMALAEALFLANYPS